MRVLGWKDEKFQSNSFFAFIITFSKNSSSEFLDFLSIS